MCLLAKFRKGRPWASRGLCGAAMMLAIASGCSGDPPTWPVTGRVLFRDGTPVASAVIEFAPVDGGAAARGKIGPDGRFELKTEQRTGAVAGTHRVAIVQMVLADGLAEHARKHHLKAHVVHARYRRFETSQLEKVVQAGTQNEFVFEVDADDVAPAAKD